VEFITVQFAILIVVTFILYYARINRKWQHALLLMASMIFIGYYHLIYLVYALGITFFTFYVGKVLHRKIDERSASWIFTGSIVFLVAIWLAARYWSHLFPLGISFYTFQALSYLIEIYWGEDSEDDFLDFTLYMLLFMKFLSGPIERAENMLPQLKSAHSFNYGKIVRGLKLVAWGVFMKLVVADRIAPSLDMVFSDVHSASGIQMMAVTLLYPIQLYADFAGYTNMALGFGTMFGFKFIPNFDRPFISLSTGELWRRWHQSLSFWVRDYVYTPLSAETRHWKRWGAYFSVLVTFVIIGVWHGAGLTFAIYGLFQGIVIIYEMAAKHWREGVREHLGEMIYRPLMMLRTYILFALSLLFFRVSKLGDVFYIYRHLFDGSNLGVKDLRLSLTDPQWITFGIAVVFMFLVEYVNSMRNLISWSAGLRAWQRWSLYVVFVTIIFLCGAFGVENFIYVQF
jgi:alginate O-acetyltransferase complex protein AlgI